MNILKTKSEGGNIGDRGDKHGAETGFAKGKG